MLAPPTIDQMKPVARSLRAMVNYLSALKRRLERRGYTPGNCYFDRVEAALLKMETLAAWTDNAASPYSCGGQSTLTMRNTPEPRQPSAEDCCGEGI